MQRLKMLAACSPIVGALLATGWLAVSRLAAQIPGEVVSSSGVITRS